MTQALILFAHGSRDPQWRAPIEAVATRVRALAPQVTVACAYLELTEPDLPTVAAQLVASHADEIWIKPMFLGVGKHAREDLPKLVDALRQTYPGVRFHLEASVGEETQVLDSLAAVALAHIKA
jgi:sirohydrochlorin cobaltochelatase